MNERLDTLLVKLNLVSTRSKAQDLIKKGKVRVDGKVVVKASSKFTAEQEILVDSSDLFVGRGAEKLRGAHEDFDISFEDKVVGDMGASTGGFTEYALLNGAKKVYAVDVGHDQLDSRLKSDSRVINLEGKNIKEGLNFGEKCDLVVIDLSFISLIQVIDPILNILKNEGELLALVKPQFEVGKEGLGKNGIVKSKKHIQKSLIVLYDEFLKRDLIVKFFSPCKIKGRTGNQEYFFYCLYGRNQEFLKREMIIDKLKDIIIDE